GPVTVRPNWPCGLLPVTRYPLPATRYPLPLFRILSNPEVLLPPAAHELVGFEVSEVIEVADQGLLQNLGGPFMVGLRAAGRLGHDLVDHAELQQSLGRDVEGGGCLLSHLRALAVLPQDDRAPFDRDHRIDGVLEHENAVAHSQSQRTTGAALADDRGDDRYLEATHLVQVSGDRLRLTALFGAQTSPGALRIDEGDNRHVELLRQLHEPQRFAVSLRMWHAKVASQVFLGVPTALVADDHNRLAVQPRPSADDGCVIAEAAVPVHLDEISEGQSD